MNKLEIDKLNKISKKLRLNIIKAALEAGSSSAHVGGALSFVDIVTTLFFKIFDQKKFKMTSEDRDRFILSKGHGCLGLYSALLEKKFISKKEFKTFEKNGSKILGHPVINKKLGIEFSNGSLGMGLSLGLGVAIALKKKNLKNQVYVLLGDGECNEGSVWEAAMSAPKFKLDNLNVILDKNNFQQTGSNDEIMSLGNVVEKWKSFGWDVDTVDGHDILELKKYFDNENKNLKPKILIANTIKGKGFSFSENDNAWHHSVMTKNIYEKAKEELKNGS